MLAALMMERDNGNRIVDLVRIEFHSSPGPPLAVTD
jgi:hypothetical protein